MVLKEPLQSVTVEWKRGWEGKRVMGAGWE